MSADRADFLRLFLRYGIPPEPPRAARLRRRYERERERLEAGSSTPTNTVNAIKQKLQRCSELYTTAIARVIHDSANYPYWVPDRQDWALLATMLATALREDGFALDLPADSARQESAFVLENTLFGMRREIESEGITAKQASQNAAKSHSSAVRSGYFSSEGSQDSAVKEWKAAYLERKYSNWISGHCAQAGLPPFLSGYLHFSDHVIDSTLAGMSLGGLHHNPENIGNDLLTAYTNFRIRPPEQVVGQA